MQVSEQREKEGAGRYFCPFQLGRRWSTGGAALTVHPLIIRVVDCRPVIREKGRVQAVSSTHFGWEEGDGPPLHNQGCRLQVSNNREKG
jgi:hypothetical protein